jgi:acyl-CoA synthetase (AMP-forming)/AMP-acid ligase II
MYTVETEQINPAVFDEGAPNTYTFFETDGTVIEIGDKRIDEIRKQLDVLSGIEEWVYVDEDEDELGPGAIGELQLRSPATMVGYWNDLDATAATLTADGWLRTGDLATVDATGCITLAGRRTEMFIRGGYNVFPAEVEAVLGEHPAVAALAVVPRPDDVLGELGVAVVVPTDPADPPTLVALRDFGSAALAHHKLPDDLVLTDALPLTVATKLDRSALRHLVATQGSANGADNDVADETLQNTEPSTDGSA